MLSRSQEPLSLTPLLSSPPSQSFFLPTPFRSHIVIYAVRWAQPHCAPSPILPLNSKRLGQLHNTSGNLSWCLPMITRITTSLMHAHVTCRLDCCSCPVAGVALSHLFPILNPSPLCYHTELPKRQTCSGPKSLYTHCCYGNIQPRAADGKSHTLPPPRG